jgi:crotonobetainyl-CoA:carnitine CoA-transferase CaiB-like acyl-CoA transferase
MAALISRLDTGIGAYVDLSATEAVAAAIGDVLLGIANGLAQPTRMGNEHHPDSPHDVFPCAGTDEWIAIAVETDDQWHSLCNVLDAAEPLADRRFTTRRGRWRCRRLVAQAVSGCTCKWDASILELRLLEAGVPAARSRSLLDLVTEPSLEERGFWQTVSHPQLGKQRIAGLPWLLSWPTPRVVTGGPALGQDTDRILGNVLGMSAPEIDALRHGDVLD